MGDAGIQLAQRSCGSITRIGECLAAVAGLPCVQGSEIAVAHIDFAAHLQHLGGAGDLLRNILYGAGICGDIFAHFAVAARGCLYQFAPLIAQRQRQPVDFRLGGIDQMFGLSHAQIFPDAAVEFGDLFIGKGIAQRQHPHRMAYLAEPFGNRTADLFTGAVGPLKVGQGCFDGQIALAHRVIVRIADLGRVIAVIGDIGSLNLGSQPGQFRPRLFGRQFIDRGVPRCGSFVFLFLAQFRPPNIASGITGNRCNS